MKKRVFGRALYVLYLLILLEVCGRAYWSFAHDVPFWRMENIFYVYYPEAEAVRESHCGDEGLDVLLLGASVLNNQFSPTIEPLLSESLRAHYHQDVCIHNVSRSAHTTLDSYHKYRELSDLFFDMVVVYHGINETRANNCPSSIFRDDYTHYAWYEKINAMTEHGEIGYLVFPWTLRYAYLEYKSRNNPDQYVPRHLPKSRSWMKMGARVKTEKSFRKNMTSILQLAEDNGSQVVSMTFAYYLPRNYSKGRLHRGTLGYAEAGHGMPVEVWGLPQNVVNGIDTHNRVVRDLAADENLVQFVDQENTIPKRGRYFTDLCHLSLEGQRRWVDNFMEHVELPALLGSPPSEKR